MTKEEWERFEKCVRDTLNEPPRAPGPLIVGHKQFELMIKMGWIDKDGKEISTYVPKEEK